MQPSILIIDNNFKEQEVFYKTIAHKYELHLAGCAEEEIEIDNIDTSRVFLKNARPQIEFVEQDFINACMLFVQIYVPEFVYFRNKNELLTENSIDKICSHAQLVGVKVVVHQSLKPYFEKNNFTFVTDESLR